MKIFRSLLTILLAFLILTGSVACTFLETPLSEETELKIYDYLEKKYPDLEFEITSYSQDTYTSGKYIFNVNCKTTDVDFLVYQSSFLITDSYTVTYANLAMEEKLVAVLGKTIMTDYAKSIQWLDIYADGNTGYKFRDVDLTTLPESVVGIDSIYRVVIDAQNTPEVFETLKIITEKFDHATVHCSSITFEWVQNDYTIVFTTDTCTINNATEEELASFIDYVDGAKKNDEFITISFVSRIKRVQASTTDISPDKFIPGLHEKTSDTEINASGSNHTHIKETTPQ